VSGGLAAPYALEIALGNAYPNILIGIRRHLFEVWLGTSALSNSFRSFYSWRDALLLWPGLV